MPGKLDADSLAVVLAGQQMLAIDETITPVVAAGS
jgi:hypothetical protein